MRNQKGFFTIAEMTISLLITMIFIAAFMGTFLGMRNSMYAQDSYTTSNRTAYQTMNLISKDVREAVSIEDTWGARTTGTSVLVLRLPSIDASGVPTDLTADFDYVTYRVNGTNLLRSLDVLDGTSSRNGGTDITDKIVGSNVSTVTFSSTGGTAFSALTAAQQEALRIFNVAITSSETIAGTARTMVTDSDMVLLNK